MSVSVVDVKHCSGSVFIMSVFAYVKHVKQRKEASLRCVLGLGVCVLRPSVLLSVAFCV